MLNTLMGRALMIDTKEMDRFRSMNDVYATTMCEK